MRIKVFGPPTVLRDGVPVAGALAQRRRLALVSLLAIGAPPGRAGLSRERIVELLWPSDDVDRSRAALSQALYAIRRDLGSEDAIVGQSDLRLNPDRVTCDYWDFLRALAEGADAAAAAARSGPLLDGLDLPEIRSFEFWAEEQRNDADRRWAAATDRAAAAAERAGDVTAAIELRRALANVDPTSSRTALGLARALVAAGEREGALRHLRVHAALVEQELDAAPDPAVVTAADRLQAGTLPDGWEPTRGSSTPPAAPELAVSAGAGTAPRAVEPRSQAAPPPVQVATPERASPDPRRWLVPVVAATVLIAAIIGFGARGHEPPQQGRDGAVFAIGRIEGDTLGDAVAGMLATNLARAQDLEVIGTARMLELGGGDRDRARQLAAARDAGATDLVEGTMIRQGSRWRLELRRTTVATGRVAEAVRTEGSDLFALVDGASAELLGTIGRGTEALGIADVSSRSLEAWHLYMEARRAETEGRRETAVAQMRGALRSDSTFALAAIGLAELIGSADAEYLPLLRRALRLQDRVTPKEAMWIRAQWLAAMDDPALGPLVDSMASRYPRDLDVRMMVAGPAVFQRGDFAGAARALVGVWRADSARLGEMGRPRCYACEAVIHLGTVYELADSLPAIERWVRRTLALRPTDGRMWARLANVLERDVARHREMDAAVDSALRHGERGALEFRLLAATRRGDTAAFAAVLPQVSWYGPTARASEHWARTILLRNAGRLDEALREARAYAAVRKPAASEESRTERTLEAAVLLDLGRGREAAVIWDSIAGLPRPEWTPSRVARQRTFYRTLAATARYEAGDTTGLFALADSLAVDGAASGYLRDRTLHHHVRGLAHLARGALPAAITELRRAIPYPSAGFTRTNWHLADALERSGNPEDAARWLDAAARASRDASPLYLSPRRAHDAAERLRARRR